MNIFILPEWGSIMNNKLLKQWEQDIKDYGDNAYLLWEWCNMAFIYENAKSNSIIDNMIITNGCRRKQSAELPFDLERAKAGDEIELIHKKADKNIKATFVSRFRDFPIFIFIHGRFNHFYHVPEKELCMKYPPKAKK